MQSLISVNYHSLCCKFTLQAQYLLYKVHSFSSKEYIKPKDNIEIEFKLICEIETLNNEIMYVQFLSLIFSSIF